MSTRTLYLHIPFCKRKCAYCDFVSFETACNDPLMDAYRRALMHQVEQAVELGILEGLDTAYIGGGTPSYLGSGLADLVEQVASLGPSEFTVEANPDSATFELLSRVKDAGCTRISLGVQSLSDDELAALGRVHDAKTARRALKTAVDLGFDVSCDLMCAIPRQTSSSWHDTLAGIVDSGVGHVSVYPLMIEEGTPFARAVDTGAMDEPDDADEADRMEEASAILDRHGFKRYEVASYALDGCECRHNRAYWSGVSYLGLGTGASSMFGEDDFAALEKAFPQLEGIPASAARVRLTNITDRRRMAEKPDLAHVEFEVEYLDERESLAEDLMLGARMACGLDASLVTRARAVMGSELDECLASIIDDGYLDGRLAPTRKGWLLGNELYGRLWGLAHPENA